MPTKEDLQYFQSMPLEVKVGMAKTRIREWVRYYGTNGVYVSFSGGKDSTVLLHMVRELYPDIPAVFVNTGLEYPEIQSFAKSFDNVTVLTPKMTFVEVVKKYGYPFIGKEFAFKLMQAKSKPDGYGAQSFNAESEYCKKYPSYSYSKYKDLLYADFNISNQCCDVMKKKPSKQYENKNDKKPFIATMASESRIRANRWYKQGCNAFDNIRPTSQPMSFWTENDVLRYIKDNNIKICEVYGDIVPNDGQYTFEECLDDQKLCTTGCDRTGCIFCGFGAQLDKYSRFLRLKETHPKQYNYCIGGGEYDIDGIWKPNKKGLGMGHVIDELNKLYSKNGKAFIEY